MASDTALVDSLSLPMRPTPYVQHVPKSERPATLPVTRDDVYTTAKPAYSMAGVVDTLTATVGTQLLGGITLVIFEGGPNVSTAAVHDYCKTHDYAALFKATGHMTQVGLIGVVSEGDDGGLVWDDGLLSQAKYAAMQAPTAVFFDEALDNDIAHVLADFVETGDGPRFPTHRMSGIDPRACVMESTTANALTVIVRTHDLDEVDDVLRARATCVKASDDDEDALRSAF